MAAEMINKIALPALIPFLLFQFLAPVDVQDRKRDEEDHSGDEDHVQGDVTAPYQCASWMSNAYTRPAASARSAFFD
jgi:hypothetical protein